MENTNLLNEYAYMLSGAQKRFTLLGESDLEKSKNIIFLCKFVLRDVCKLSYEEAKKVALKPSFYKDWKLDQAIYQNFCFPTSAETVCKTRNFGLLLYIIYNDLDLINDSPAIIQEFLKSKKCGKDNLYWQNVMSQSVMKDKTDISDFNKIKFLPNEENNIINND